MLFESDVSAEVGAIVLALPEIARGVQGRPGGIGQDLGVGHVRAISQLASAEELTMGELARSLGVSCATATHIIDHLVNLGLARRKRCQRDRRIVRVSLTEHARATAHEVWSRRRRQVEEVISQLSPAEAAALAKGMSLLARVLVRDLETATEGAPATGVGSL